ncbi:MAG: response regulator transcription factor [Planctomycetota bacterium]|nr:response regulator transcription factor [Planctomycetota bacterium]
MSHRILLIEDDRKLAPLVRSFLEDNHLEVAWASDGDQGWREFERIGPDLVVLDLMLPGRDGLTLCRQIRARSQAGILILTAKGDETDRVVGLELGADDYLTKPFGLPELLARIKAILRRIRPPSEQEQVADRSVGPFTIDASRRLLARAGKSIDLTRSEFDILERLTKRPGRVFSREELLEEVRGGETEAFYRAVDTHISNLRAKIEVDPKKPVFIETVWGVGYRWAGS